MKGRTVKLDRPLDYSKGDIVYEPLKLGEEKQVIDLVLSVFDEFVAPLYVNEGIVEFRRYANMEALAKRSQAYSFVLIAKVNADPIGIIEMTDYSHVAMLFVRRSFQKQGIGKALVRKTIDNCLKHRPDLRKITVNASPNSVSAYKKMVFNADEDEQIANGIRFTAMGMILNQ
jgi:GNAT superfamily N-acetyltransferase